MGKIKKIRKKSKKGEKIKILFKGGGMRTNPKHQEDTHCYLLLKGKSTSEKKRIEKEFISFLKKHGNIGFVVHLCDKIRPEIMENDKIHKISYKNGSFDYIKKNNEI